MPQTRCHIHPLPLSCIPLYNIIQTFPSHLYIIYIYTLLPPQARWLSSPSLPSLFALLCGPILCFPAMPFLYETDLPFSSFSRISNPASSALSSTSARMGGNIAGTRQQQSRGNISVAQALEIARDSAEGAQDPTVIYILESALSDIWRRIQAHPGASFVVCHDPGGIRRLQLFPASLRRPRLSCRREETLLGPLASVEQRLKLLPWLGIPNRGSFSVP